MMPPTTAPVMAPVEMECWPLSSGLESLLPFVMGTMAEDGGRDVSFGQTQGLY